MKLRNNQSLTFGKRAEYNLQLMTGINAALHDKDSGIELSKLDIEYLLLRCMQMNTGRNYQISYHDDPVNETPLSAVERLRPLSDENKSVSPVPETGSSGDAENDNQVGSGDCRIKNIVCFSSGTDEPDDSTLKELKELKAVLQFILDDLSEKGADRCKSTP